MDKSKRTTARKAANLKPSPPEDASPTEWATWQHDRGEADASTYVTPIRSGEKAAYQPNWSKKPLKTRGAVERHWKAHPDDNIGGVPRLGNFWLDADDLDVLDALEKEKGRLPSTYTQRTLNGNLHFVNGGVKLGHKAV